VKKVLFRFKRDIIGAAVLALLLAQLAAEGAYDEEQLVKFRAQLLNIEADEQASLGALVVACQNEQAIAQGHADKVVPLTLLQRLTMHAIDWSVAPQK
jgi:hypothetical protein